MRLFVEISLKKGFLINPTFFEPKLISTLYLTSLVIFIIKLSSPNGVLHPVVYLTMFCFLSQMRLNTHLKENLLRNAKIAFKFEWIKWFSKYWSQCGRFSSAFISVFICLDLFKLYKLYNSPKLDIPSPENRRSFNNVYMIPYCLNLKEKSKNSTYRHISASIFGNE